MTTKQPSTELLEQRPVLKDDPPSGNAIGNPPAKYTRAVHERICQELRGGQRPQGACARAGITTATFYDWVKRGKSGDPHLWEFAEDVEKAYNEAEASAVDVVQTAVHSVDPELGLKAASYWLERARPDGYSKQVKTLVDKQIESFMVRLEKALAGLPAQMLTGDQIFELILAVYVGQGPVGEIASRPAPTAMLVESNETGTEE